MTVTINGTSGITTPGVNSTGSNVLGDNVADTLNVGNGAIVTDSSGNVGIGTSSPSGKLHVLAASGTQRSYFEASAAHSNIRLVAASTSYNSTVEFFSGASNIANINGLGAGGLTFETANTERMRIDSNGNLLVGTTSQLFSGKLSVAANTTSAQGIVINNTGGGSGQAINFATSGTSVGNISTTGSATAYNTSSDYRLKENVQPMQNALGVVAQLNPVTYTWKADGSDGQGFIAHELQAVVPDCVTGEKDAVDADGNPVYQGIDTSFLVATLAKAIQEQQAQIETLTAKVAALEAK